MKTAKAGHLHMLMSSAFSVHSTMCGTLVRGKILTKLYTRQLITLIVTSVTRKNCQMFIKVARK